MVTSTASCLASQWTVDYARHPAVSADDRREATVAKKKDKKKDKKGKKKGKK